MKILSIFLAGLGLCLAAKKTANPIETMSDHKDFKKVLRTRTNLMVVFHGSKLDKVKEGVITSVAGATKGKGTFIRINCDEAKKLCKKLKVSVAGKTYLLKHFKDGEYNLDYDRPFTETSLSAFILDPAGDPLWEEEPDASDVTFFKSPSSFSKGLKKSDSNGMLVMFYAPWCGHCKRMKPDYQQAAKEIKGKAVVAAMDVNKPVNNPVKNKYNITGFPTLIYFENGEKKFGFDGRTKKEILDFLMTPYPREAPKEIEKEEEVPWSQESPEILHLTDDTFDEMLVREKSALVMFYAPWCGHCKRMKPDYVSAAKEMKAKGIPGVLAAVDATKERNLGKRFDVKGFPTIKYFKNGELMFEAGDARKHDEIIKFMSDPKEPPPPPPPEKPWSEEAPDVEHLTGLTFRTFLKKKKHVLVMFYAPWCGHCKAAKPEISAAATELVDNFRVKFAGVDCTEDQELCKKYGVKGYPTFKYFSYFDKEQADYDGGRKKEDFIAFMKDPQNPPKPPPPPGGEDSWKEHQGHEHLLHLHDDDFQVKLGSVEHALVLYYAPWCGHCKNMKPAYAKAAEMAATSKAFSGKSFTVAAVDATTERKVTTGVEITGYPTIMYIKDGAKPVPYTGGRQAQNFFEFMKERVAAKSEL